MKKSVFEVDEGHFKVFCDCGENDHTLDVYVDDGFFEILATSNNYGYFRKLWNAVCGKTQFYDIVLQKEQAKEMIKTFQKYL